MNQEVNTTPPAPPPPAAPGVDAMIPFIIPDDIQNPTPVPSITSGIFITANHRCSFAPPGESRSVSTAATSSRIASARLSSSARHDSNAASGLMLPKGLPMPGGTAGAVVAGAVVAVVLNPGTVTTLKLYAVTLVCTVAAIT